MPKEGWAMDNNKDLKVCFLVTHVTLLSGLTLFNIISIDQLWSTWIKFDQLLFCRETCLCSFMCQIYFQSNLNQFSAGSSVQALMQGMIVCLRLIHFAWSIEKLQSASMDQHGLVKVHRSINTLLLHVRHMYHWIKIYQHWSHFDVWSTSINIW